MLHAGPQTSRPLPFIYLDLDRSSIPPDNPDALLEEAVRQILTQIPQLADRAAGLQEVAIKRLEAEESTRSTNFASSAHFARSEYLRKGLAELLEQLALHEGRNVLMVIDTFEVAQRRGALLLTSSWNLQRGSSLKHRGCGL